MGFTDLDGALVRLRLVREADVPRLHARLQRPEVWPDAGCDEAPTRERMNARLSTWRTFVAWELHGAAGGGAIGYVGLVSYSGPPFVWLDVFAGEPPLDVLQEALSLVVPAFFGDTQESSLYVHVDRAAEELAQPMLLDAGFTPVDAVPFQDARAKASFVIDRDGYEAYYRDGIDGLEES